MKGWCECVIDIPYKLLNSPSFFAVRMWGKGLPDRTTVVVVADSSINYRIIAKDS